MAPTVHILLHGLTLCRQVHGLPCSWGKQHRWVSIDDPKRDGDVTCPVCIEVVGAMKQLREGFQ